MSAFLEYDPVPRHCRRALAELTPRQLEVLELMARGLSNEGISRRLWITDATLQSHIRSILITLRLAPGGELDRRVAAVIVYREAVLDRTAA